MWFSSNRLVLEVLDLVVHLLDGLEVLVDHRIEQTVHQRSRTEPQQVMIGRPRALRRLDVELLVPDSDQRGRQHKTGDSARDQSLVLLRAVGRLD